MQMSAFLKECYKILKANGVLLLWFTHRSINAWETIIKALCNSKFSVTKIWPTTSELLTRLVTKGNGERLNRTLIIVARKKDYLRESNEKELENLTIELIDDMYETLSKLDVIKTEVEIFLLAAAMCAVTKIKDADKKIDDLISKTKEIAREYIPKLLEKRPIRDKKEYTLDFLE